MAILFCSFAAQAQDNIFLKSGEVQEVYIKKISGDMIYYSGKPGGPQRYFKKSAVEKIVYRNGRTVIVDKPLTKAGKRHAERMRDNVLTLAPAHLLYFGAMNGLGIGLDYERFFGERHLLSVHVPVYIGVATDQGTDEYEPFTDVVPFYTSPGIRLHVLKPSRKLDYAIGVSVVVGTVTQTYNRENSYMPAPNVEQRFLLTAVTLDNDFCLFSKRNVGFGLHTAVGPVLGDFGDDGKWMVQIGFKIGRRF